VHGAQQLELGFEFHQIIKAVDHRADGRFAADYFVEVRDSSVIPAMIAYTRASLRKRRVDDQLSRSTCVAISSQAWNARQLRALRAGIERQPHQ
jgi:hypothetical protein